MRRDWDERARAGAQQYIYTRDSCRDEADFDASGRANYNQLVRPYLPVLLDGRSPRDCRALEIGCGVGRMTRWFAGQFGHVDGVDVSPAMIEQARTRLEDCPNAGLHVGSGHDLGVFADASFDLAFSYIVFQHVPARAVIERYIRDTARVLKPRGVFKFQLNGDQSPAYRGHQPDTWQGVAFAPDEAAGLLADAGFSLVAAEGAGTQYFVLTARKGKAESEAAPRSYIFPGEPWAAEQLREGWGAAVDQSWRPMASRSEALLAVPPGEQVNFFIGLYLWPGESSATHRVKVDGIGEAEITGPGDHYLEFAGPGPRPARIQIAIEPAPRQPPAVRALGYFLPVRAAQ